MQRLSEDELDDWTDDHTASLTLCEEEDGLDLNKLLPDQTHRLINGQEYILGNESFIGAVIRYTDDGDIDHDMLFRNGDDIVIYSSELQTNVDVDVDHKGRLAVVALVTTVPLLPFLLMLPGAVPFALIPLLLGLDASLLHNWFDRTGDTVDVETSTELTDEQYEVFPITNHEPQNEDEQHRLAFLSLIMKNYERAYDGDEQFAMKGENAEGETIIQAHSQGFHETYRTLYERHGEAMKVLKSELD